MATREPVLLTVLIETQAQRWNVAGIPFTGRPFVLIRSQLGNLDQYLGLGFDEQVSFLRHRLAGVLQRGCDRLWGRDQKPSHILFVTDGLFAQSDPDLTHRVANHFATWMTSPPVAFYIADGGFANGSLQLIAGEQPKGADAIVRAGIMTLSAAVAQDDGWEVAPNKKA